MSAEPWRGVLRPCRLSLESPRRGAGVGEVRTRQTGLAGIRPLGGRSSVPIGDLNDEFDLSPELMGARRLERILWLRHQHPRQYADAYRTAAARPEDA